MQSLLLSVSLLVSPPADPQASDKDSTDPIVNGKPLSVWVKNLTEKDDKVRLAAWVAIMKLGVKAKPAVPALIGLLKDNDDWHVRSRAAGILSDIREGAKDAVPALVNALKTDTAWQVRSASLHALYSIKDKSAVPGIAEALRKDMNATVRAEAIDALAHFESEARPAIPALIEALKDDDPDVRDGAASVLGQVAQEPEKCVPALLKAMKDESPGVRSSAAGAIGYFGDHARVSIPDLVEGLKDSDASVRVSAAGSLWRISKRKDVIPLLTEALTDEKAYVVSASARVLGQIGPEAKDAVPNLAKAAERKDIFVRIEAVKALGMIAENPEVSIPTLVKALREEAAPGRRGAGSFGRGYTTWEEAKARRLAAESLGRFGKDAKSAIPDLVAALKNQDAEVRVYAAQSLWIIAKHQDAVPTLIRSLKKGFGQSVVPIAAKALGEIGPDAKDAVPALREAINKSEDAHERQVIAEALKKIER